MQFLTLFLSLLVLFGCGKKQIMHVVPKITSEELRTQIDRITPLLLWCDEGPTGNTPHDIDGRPNCNLGDNAAEIGFLTLVGEFANEQRMFEVLRKSFTEDGRPLRSPSYTKQTTKTFSRDQLLGFIGATVAGFPVQYGVARIVDYYQRTGSMCEDSQACWITPGLKVLIKYVMGEDVTVTEKAVEAAETKLEARTVPLNYQADLVMKKIYTLVKLGRATTAHARAATIVYTRAPNNLWFNTVYHITNKGNTQAFENIASRLVSCMKEWKTPGADWNWSKGDTECFSGSPGLVGHELVALGHLLLNVQAAIIEDGDAQVYIKDRQVHILPE